MDDLSRLLPTNTKGDLISYSTAPDRLAVGPNGYAVIADNTQAAGIKWAPVFLQDGNAFGTTAKIGTTDANDLIVKLSGVDMWKFTQAGGLIALDDGYAIGDLNHPPAFSGSAMDFANPGDATAGLAISPSQISLGDSVNPPDVFIYRDVTSHELIAQTSSGTYALTPPSGGTVSPLTTKGDVWTYSTVNARLAVGTNNFVLMADSSATTGNKWAAMTDALLSTSDITTNNVVSTKHGFAPKSPADATQFLNGGATPAWAAVKDSDLSTTDITTNNASTSKHGFLLKLNNDATYFMNGVGAWAIPPGTGGSPLTTKGDIFTYSTLAARLPIGSNGYILSADSGEATGLKWIAAPSGTISGLTTGTVPKAASSSTLADSLLVETSGLITVGGALSATVVRAGGFTGGDAYIGIGIANDKVFESRTVGGTVVEVFYLGSDDKIHFGDTNLLPMAFDSDTLTLGGSGSSVITTSAVFRPRGTTGSPSIYASIFISNDRTIESKLSGGTVCNVIGLYGDNVLHVGDTNAPIILESNSIFIGAGSSSDVKINGDALGFYGTTPGAKPTITGSKVSTAALGSLLTALATLGLIVDGSSA